jgi:oligopeptide/dipeptide ABC transporter ATP-binding protein
MSYSIEFRDLTREFRMGGMLLGEKIIAVDNVSFSIKSEEPWILSIVGESGSGKTTLARILLRLLDRTAGEILLEDMPLSEYGRDKKQFYKKVQPIFQNPFTAFSRRRTVESYLFETCLHLDLAKTRAEALELISKTLNSVGLDYAHVKGKFPSQFSGGELQRISIARALIPKPAVIVADEPVSMIDASMRMNIVNLFKSLAREYKVSFIYITHDLSTAYYVSNYIAAMYRGNLIEFGDAKTILDKPAHPYMELLLDSIPMVGKRWGEDMVLPDFEHIEYGLKGCRFSGRCPYRMDICATRAPDMISLSDKQRVLCHKYNREFIS